MKKQIVYFCQLYFSVKPWKEFMCRIQCQTLNKETPRRIQNLPFNSVEENFPKKFFSKAIFCMYKVYMKQANISFSLWSF